MPTWKAIVVSHSDMDNAGQSDVIFDVFKDDIIKYSKQLVRMTDGSDPTPKVVNELQKFKTLDDAFQINRLAPDTEILLQ